MILNQTFGSSLIALNQNFTLKMQGKLKDINI